MTSNGPNSVGDSNLGTEPLTVVEWEEIKPAADELFQIWFEKHDLKWACHVWAQLPKIKPETLSGEELANSLVTLIAMAMLSSTFWEHACGEPGQAPEYVAHDAMLALDLDGFFVGQIYPWSAPTHGGGSISFSEILCDLGRDRARILVQYFADELSEASIADFFSRVPEMVEGDVDDADERWSEVPVQRYDRVFDWANGQCRV